MMIKVISGHWDEGGLFLKIIAYIQHSAVIQKIIVFIYLIILDLIFEHH